MNKWTSVKDKLPKFNTPVVVTDGKIMDIMTCWIMTFSDGHETIIWSSLNNWDCDNTFECGFLASLSEYNITHWTPLPELPNVKPN